MTISMLPGPYRIPAYRACGHFRLTNKTPAATYRAPGRYEGSFVRELLMDEVAERLGLDPIEIRRRNLITRAEMPFSRPLSALGTDVVYDSGDYALLLDKALARIGWTALQGELSRRRKAGELVGAAVAIFVDKGGLGPADGTRVSVDTTGAVELVTGGSNVGQGFATVMAQICADALGVDYRRLRVDCDTGAVTVERYLVAYDIGRAINPMLVEGQLVGGVVQGLGGALYEEFRYDERGEPLSVTLADYLMPTLREIPPIDVLLTEDAPSPLNPLGIKSAGEGGITPVRAVIAAAIDDAIGLPGGVTQLPATPQRVKALLRRRQETQAATCLVRY